MCYFFDPRDLWNSKSFSLHGVRCCVMNSPVHIVFVFNAKPGGGGGDTSICMHIGYVLRERPPFSALNFRSGAYHFHKLPRIRSGASPFYIFWRILPFRRPSFSKILFFQPVHRLPRPAQPERFAFLRSAAPRVSGRSGDSHFHAHNGSNSFRSPTFSRSKRLKLVPEPRIFKLKTAQARSGAPHFQARPGTRSGALAHFSLCRGIYLPKFGVSTPPPPPPPGMRRALSAIRDVVILEFFCVPKVN